MTTNDRALPPGITGFWGRGASPPPTVDPAEFRACCHRMAREAGLRLRAFDVGLGGVQRNYLQALFVVGAAQLLVLCNTHVPWFCAAAGPPEGAESSMLELEHVFLDPPSWLRPEAAGSRVLSRLELDSPLGRSDPRLARLAPAELAQVRYWRPERVGDVIYNRWD